MKRIDEDDIRWMARHAANSNRARARAKEKRKGRRMGRLLRAMAHVDDGIRRIRDTKGNHSRQIDRHAILCPKSLDLDEHYRETITFIDRIRRYVLEKRQDVFIDMIQCEYLSPEAALVLAAELQRCMHFFPNGVTGRDPRNSEARAMLRDLGFHDLCGFRKPSGHESNRQLRYIAMDSGNHNDTSIFAPLVELVLGDVASLDNEMLSNDLLTGLNEAMLNVLYHAYPDEFSSATVSPDHRWWIAGYRDADEREIMFMFYDQGATIPATLGWKWGEFMDTVRAKMKSIFLSEGESTDGTLIKAAMENKRTAKPLIGGRGLGLNDLRTLIGTYGDGGASGCNDAGGLRILSRRGSYLYKYPDFEDARSLPLPLSGTLIVWRMVGGDKVIWSDGR